MVTLSKPGHRSLMPTGGGGIDARHNVPGGRRPRRTAVRAEGRDAPGNKKTGAQRRERHRQAARARRQAPPRRRGRPAGSGGRRTHRAIPARAADISMSLASCWIGLMVAFPLLPRVTLGYGFLVRIGRAEREQAFDNGTGAPPRAQWAGGSVRPNCACGQLFLLASMGTSNQLFTIEVTYSAPQCNCSKSRHQSSSSLLSR